MNVNTPIDYSSRYSFGHFCCRVKQGKRLSEFLQKYTNSGTETTHLAVYNILVFKYVTISAGLPLLFIGAIREKKLKIRYCIIWRCLRLMFSTTNVSDKWNVRGFERMLPYEQYPEEKSRLWLSSFKENWSTFLSNPKSFEDKLLYLYVIWNMLKSADLHETILTQVICHKHVRCHDAVFLREISIGRSKEDEKWIFFIYFSRFPLSEVKKNKTKK